MKSFCIFCGVSFERPTKLCPLCSSEEGLLASHDIEAQPQTTQIEASQLQGEELAGYRLRRLLGRGSMGAVYLAEHGQTHTRAAIKLLRPKYTQNQELVTRFLREARAAGQRRHPNIVEVFDSGFDAGLGYYLVMEYLQGESLQQYLNVCGRLSPYEAALLVLQILDGLSAAHEAGVVHRDLKPANIFLQQHQNPPRVKLLDFGVAKLLSPEAQELQTRTGAVLGTPAYMSPEQSSGRRDIDPRADLYSVGVIFFELLAGRRPFVAETPGKLLVMHQMEKPPVPSSVVPGLPAPLDALILSCLEKAPERRPASAAALKAQVAALLPSLPRRASVLPAPVPVDENAETRIDPPKPLDSGSLSAAAGEMMAPALPRAAAPRRSARAWAGIAAGVVACIGAAVALWPAPAPLTTSTAPTSAVAPAAVVVVESIPNGALVRNKSGQLLGLTPFSIARPHEPIHLTLEQEGFAPIEVILDVHSPALLRIPMRVQ